MVEKLLSEQFRIQATEFFFGGGYSTGINGVILFLFALGLLLLIYGAFRTWFESRCLKKARVVFEGMKKREPEALVQGIEQEKLSRRSLVYKAIREIRDVVNLEGKVEFVSDSLRASYYPKSSWSRFIAGILIIMGLIGTILGLSDAVLSLKEILNSIDNLNTSSAFKESVDRIVDSLGFMETAFSTTLCGFVCFVLLSFFDAMYLRVQETFAERFESFVSQKLIPFFTPKNVEESLAEVADVIKLTGSGMREASESLSGLADNISENQRVFGQLAGTLYGTVEGMNQSRTEVASQYKELVGINESVRGLVRDIEETLKKNNELNDALAKKMGGDRAEIETLYGKLTQSNNDLKETFRSSMADTCNAIRVATDIQNQEIEGIERDHDTFLKNSVHNFDKLVAAQEKILEKQKEAAGIDMAKVVEANLEITRSLEESRKMIMAQREEDARQSEARFQSFAKSMEDRLAEQMEQYSIQLRKSVSKYHASIKETNEKNRRVQADEEKARLEKYEALAMKMAETQLRMEQHQKATAKEITDVFDHLSEKLDIGVGRFLPQLGETFETLFEKQKRLLEKGGEETVKMEKAVVAILDMQKRFDQQVYAGISRDVRHAIKELKDTQQGFIFNLQDGFSTLARKMEAGRRAGGGGDGFFGSIGAWFRRRTGSVVGFFKRPRD